MTTNGESSQDRIIHLEQKRFNICQNALLMAKIMRENASLCEDFAHNFATTPIAKLAEHPNMLRGANYTLPVALADNAAAVSLISPTTEDDGKKRKRKRGDGKEKKVRDPNLPKRPPSAYLLYQNEVRKSMQEKHKDLAYKEVLGKIAASWAAMGPADKQMYNDATAVAKGTYNDLKDKYDKDNGIVSKPRKSVAGPGSTALVAAATPKPASDEEEDEVASSEEEDVKPVVKAIMPAPESSDEVEDEDSSSDEEPAPPQAPSQRPAALDRIPLAGGCKV